MKCILKLTSQSATHTEICDMAQNGYEDLRETDSLKCRRSLPYCTGRCGNEMKLPSFKFSKAKKTYDRCFRN